MNHLKAHHIFLCLKHWQTNTKSRKKNPKKQPVYGATVSPKKVNTFPYYISAQPNTMQRINLLLISDDTDESTKHHYCWIKNLDKLLHNQNSKHGGKTYFCDRCLYGFAKEICLWPCPPWFNCWFSFTLAYSRISHEHSSLFIIVINLIFMFSLWCIDRVGSLYANRIFMYFCIKSSIGTQGEVS